MGVVYIIIILFATLIGAICGMGGGVIIKPLLDAVSPFTTFQISVISGSCVLAMSVSSLIKHYFAKTKVNVKIAICLSLGSIGGGFLGDFLFGLVNDAVGTQGQPMIKIVQNSVLLVMLILVLAYMLFIKPKGIHYNFKNPILVTVVGVILGALSVFLDIGGGPINVCVFVLLFGMDLKMSSVSSLITIFFAQITKFVKYGISNSFATNVLFDNNLAIWVFVLLIVFAVIGGLLGAIINKKFSEKFVNIIYCSALGFVIILSIVNIAANALAIAQV